MNKEKKAGNFWENLVLIAIIFVIVQTFLEDLCRVLAWSINTRHAIIIAGFFFDLFFSIEFTIRSILAARKKRWNHYFIHQRGWVDLLASIPLLLFNSGPTVILLAGGAKLFGSGIVGTLNILKVIKAIRVTRILRIIRMLKIFGKIKNAESRMAQRHTATISTVGVVSIVLVLIANSIIGSLPGVPNSQKLIDKRTSEIKTCLNNVYILSEQYNLKPENLLAAIFSENENILRVEIGNKTILKKYDASYIKKYFDFDDYTKISVANFNVLYSTRTINKHNSYFNIVFLAVIIILVLGFMLVYTRHFVQTISDVIHVMNRGFTEEDYNFTVKIRGPFKDDDIFKLAEKYNETYLPLKNETIKKKEGKETKISMDDFLSSMGEKK